MMGLAGVTILAMMLHVVADVFGKFFFNYPVENTLEIVEIYYMVPVVYLPFAYVTRVEGQITVDLFTRNLNPLNAARVETLVGLVTLVAMIVLTWKTGEDAIAKTILQEIRDAGESVIIVWPSRWIPPIGCAVMALVVAARLIADVQAAFGLNQKDANNL